MNRFNTLLPNRQPQLFQPSEIIETKPFIIHMNKTDSLVVTLHSDDLALDLKKISSNNNSASKSQLELIRLKIENDHGLKKISNDISGYMDQMIENKLNNILI